jgi:transposase
LVTQPVQYGTKIKALSVLLNVDYKIPFEKIEQLLTDLYSCSFNESTAISANLTCFDALSSTEENIKIEILKSKSAHFDETGMRVEGKLHWFHTASTGLFTYLFVHAYRGKKALQSVESLIKDFKNWASYDCWASYFDFKDCSHALCNPISYVNSKD